MFLQSQRDQIYNFFDAKLPKMGLENSLKFFLIVNLVLIFYSVFNFFTIILVPIFGFLVYQMWQNIESVRQKTQINYNSLFFKSVKILYLLPFFLGIIGLILLPFGFIFWNFGLFINQSYFGNYGIFEQIFVFAMFIFIIFFTLFWALFHGIIGLSLIVYWQRLEKLVLEYNRKLE